MPDPQDPSTFARTKLNWNLRTVYPHRWLLEYYRTLLALRRQHPVLGVGGKRRLETQELDKHTLALFRRGSDGRAAFGILHFSPETRTVGLRVPPGIWRRLVDSAEERFGGLGAKSPALIEVPRPMWVEIEMAGHAAAIYLRPASMGPGTGRDGNLRGRRPRSP
jgi:maltooligosyltrehalose trehalohydrolase